MNEKQFSKILHAIEKERVPEDMDLWNEIKTQVNPMESFLARHRSIYQRRMIILAAVFALVMGTVAVWAQGPEDRKDLPKDQGLQDIEEVGLLIELNETQTQNNISMTLEYVYADVNRISIALASEAEVVPDMQLHYLVDLIDSVGTEYLPTFAGDGISPGPIPQSLHELINYNVPASVMDNETLDLILTIEVSGDDDCLPHSKDCIYEPESLANFRFEFTVKLYQGIKFDVNQTVSDGDFEIEMRDGIITPSATRIVICYGLLDYERLDTVELRVNGEIVTTENTYTFVEFSDTLDENCYFLILTQSLMEAGGEWELTIPYLLSIIFPVPQDVVDYMNENGIPATLTEDGMVKYDNIKPPEGMDIDEFEAIIANQPMPVLIHEGGPWVFKFDVNTNNE